MTESASCRLRWADLPQEIQQWVSTELGSPVVTAHSQAEGYSLGTADRLTCASGRRAFLKAVPETLNAGTSRLHRRELQVLRHLPAELPAPPLIAGIEQDGWVAMLIADVAGRHPAQPWRSHDIEVVCAALRTVERSVTVGQIPGLPSALDSFAEDFSGWSHLASDPPEDLDPWATARLPEFIERSQRGLLAMTGECLVHSDLRSDNVLLDSQGRVWLIDWPHALRGAAWIDLTLLTMELIQHGGVGATELIQRISAEYGVAQHALVDVLIGCAGYFQYTSRRPPAPGMRNVRHLQRTVGEALVGWLAGVEREGSDW